MLRRLRELQNLKVTKLKHRTSHVYACHVERSETSLILSYGTAARKQSEILRFAQNDNNVVFVLTLQRFNESRRFPHLTLESQSHLSFPCDRFAAARPGSCVAAQRALSRLAARGVVVLAVTAVAWFLWPDVSGYVGGAAWFLPVVSADDHIAKNNATRCARRL
jgi:hypothetical protein